MSTRILFLSESHDPLTVDRVCGLLSQLFGSLVLVSASSLVASWVARNGNQHHIEPPGSPLFEVVQAKLAVSFGGHPGREIAARNEGLPVLAVDLHVFGTDSPMRLLPPVAFAEDYDGR